MNNCDKYPLVSILLMSHGRSRTHTDYALRTIESLQKNLKYPNLAWYVASSCGNDTHHARVLDAIDQLKIGHHNELSTCGVSWNRGLVSCYKHSNLILVMEQDWVLPEPFDISHHVQVLEKEEHIGMVRYGTLIVNPAQHMTAKVVGLQGCHYWQFIGNWQYMYSGNPHLRHRRLNQAVGLYNEVIHPSPGDVEIDFDARFRQQDKVHIVRPCGISPWGVFSHIGNEQSYDG